MMKAGKDHCGVWEAGFPWGLGGPAGMWACGGGLLWEEGGGRGGPGLGQKKKKNLQGHSQTHSFADC